jgi:hypothetical protein
MRGGVGYSSGEWGMGRFFLYSDIPDVVNLVRRLWCRRTSEDEEEEELLEKKKEMMMMMMEKKKRKTGRRRSNVDMTLEFILQWAFNTGYRRVS